MKPLTAGEIADSVTGELWQGSPQTQIDKISIDSRQLDPGALFIAIIGENHDGHNFIEEALEAGAAALMVEAEVQVETEIPVIKVDNTTTALQDLAHYYRSKFSQLKVIAITGSAGKTTTKDMLASVLSRQYNVKKTEGNLNNHIGLPLSLLSLTGEEEVAVLEMGMSGLGEIELLTQIAEPEIGIITNVGPTHLEYLGSVENVARGKSELIAGLPETGTAILNYDNLYVRNMKSVFNGKKIIYYGFKSESEMRAVGISSENCSRGLKFTLEYQSEIVEISLPRPGDHNVYNAMAAAAAARELSVSWENIQKGLINSEISSLRLEIEEVGNVTIINDTYNANPMAVRAALDVLQDIAPSRRIAVLGDMLELGEKAESSHEEIGRYAAAQGIDILLTLGKFGRHQARGAETEGLSRGNIYQPPDKDRAGQLLKDIIAEGDTILVKGSRGNQLEDIVKELKQILAK